MSRPFRFSVNLLAACGRDEWVGKARTAESAGYDVIMVPDHLGMPAPFTSLLLAAEATERPRVAPFVLNVAFYNPTLLAREVAGLDQLTGGRLDLGLGTGYVKAEFDTAGLPFESGGQRVDRLEHTILELDRILADPDHQPRPVQAPRPPLLIGGAGDRVLRLAAKHAEIIGFTGVAKAGSLVAGDTATLVERAAFTRTAAGERADDVEFNLLIQRVAVTDNPKATLERARMMSPDRTDADLLDDTPILQIGTVKEIADRLREIRADTGISHFTVLETSMKDFAAVMEELR
ncbi:TIGR03621 family F420-dependent LLM class oxidoreductase [Fodinicola feengrottensis]|uniref:TIGR03621 family F420-dependent LLM class oxidoreductase n=1 Tax=Fodinicola feengrottensis TaxID=435914 RepID=A0ABN2FWC4_9ACTN